MIEGVFSGISKIVGEAVEENESKDQLNVIGIPAFENLMHKENLVIIKLNDLVYELILFILIII